jgi:HlyD family secretion protein
MATFKETIRKKIFYIPAIVGVLIVFISVFLILKPTSARYETVTAEKGSLIQQINVTGNVKPAESVDLSFELGGKVIKANVKVGDKIKRGQTLVVLNSGELSAQMNQAWAQVRQAQASVNAQVARLQELKLGARTEEIQISQTNLDTAKNSLNDAETNLLNVKEKNLVDLQSAYDNAVSAMQSSLTIAENSLYTITDVQYDQFANADMTGSNIAEAKAIAVQDFFGASGGGRFNNTTLASLNGGTKAAVNDCIQNKTEAKVEITLIRLKNSLQQIKNTLNAFPVDSNISTANLAKINTAKSAMNAEMISLTTRAQAISTQRSLNTTAELNAQASVNSARNNVAIAESQLNLKRGGSTKEQIAGQQAQVNQARAILSGQYASVQAIQAQLAKTAIRSPIDGIVTEQRAKVGEIIMPSTPVVSVMSDSKFQIEANIPEVDIAKLKVDNVATLTLDAYGDEKFDGRIIKINPAEKIVEGVPTYKITLQFDKDDARIKSGLTANIDILTDKRENIVIVPQRAVLYQDDGQFIRILKDDGVVREIEAKLGLRGSNGKIEVLSGVNEGDNVIISALTK